MPDYKSQIKNSRILVTGGAGFIGSNLVGYLIDQGVALVRVLDNFSNGYRRLLDTILVDQFDCLFCTLPVLYSPRL